MLMVALFIQNLWTDSSSYLFFMQILIRTVSPSLESNTLVILTLIDTKNVFIAVCIENAVSRQVYINGTKN